MKLPWYVAWLVPSQLKQQIDHNEQLLHQHKQTETVTQRNQQRKERTWQYLDATFMNYQPLIERTFAYRFFCIERDRLYNSTPVRKRDIEQLADKIIKRGEAAVLLAYYEQHFPPGSPQQQGFSIVDELEALGEAMQLVLYLDKIQQIASHMQQLVKRPVSSGTVTSLTPANVGDYRQQMRTAYEAIRKQVSKQAFPGASATVLQDEIDNRWIDWQQQNGVFATITRSQASLLRNP